MILNGAPVRIQGYLVPASISWLRTWYREQIQDPVVENRIGKKWVLGQRREGYYMTVELEPVMGTRDGEYTKVLFSVMSLDERDGHGPQALPEELRNWARRLPPDTQILSELSDHESGKHSLHLTASNRHGADYNEFHIGRVLASMGLAKQMPAETGVPRSVLFSGNGREAALVLDRTRDGASTMVLNLFIHAAQP